jgi:hypothetical protein
MVLAVSSGALPAHKWFSVVSLRIIDFNKNSVTDGSEIIGGVILWNGNL